MAAYFRKRPTSNFFGVCHAFAAYLWNERADVLDAARRPLWPNAFGRDRLKGEI
uniref:Uncharacterized protein n=1 Tax=Solanum lycopersicum TaxID=4081 RepID=A0A494G960_SOLLC